LLSFRPSILDRMYPVARLRTLGTIILSRSRPMSQLNVPVRTSADLSGWTYRSIRKNIPKRDTILAEGIMGLMWYWVLFHLWYDFGHITGHFPYPDPSKWTDAELGIPPDSED